jgi:hypothetical protein
VIANANMVLAFRRPNMVTLVTISLLWLLFLVFLLLRGCIW